MTKRKQSDGSFRADREFEYDPPSEESTLAEKLEYQRKLRKFWQSCELPSALPFARANANWWEFPYGIDEAVIAQQQLRRLKRS